MNRFVRVLASVALGIAALATTASAQVPVYPGPSGPSAPVNLDPGAIGSQAPPAPPTPSASKPNVVVIQPDGKVVDTNALPGSQTGYFVDDGSGGLVTESRPTNNGATPDHHIVRTGDTLWDICWYYFNDPWQWPKIWSYNPQITNPHWIYPGDLVRLLPRGVFASQPDATQPDKAPDQGKPDTIPPPAKHTEVGLRQIAFVEKSDLDKSMEIVGGVDEREMFGDGDAVYLSYPAGKPPQVGKTYSIYKADNPVKAHGENVGSYVHLLGTVQVQSVLEDKRAKGVITQVTQEIERHAKVGPLIKQFKNVPPVAPKVDAQANVVAMLTAGQLIGQGELVFIDIGQASGLEVGNRMFVVRRGDAYPKNMDAKTGQDDRRFPARSLGEIVIVEVGDKISVGLITLAVQEMAIGDLVMMQKAK